MDWIRIGAWVMGFGIVVGAFGAHGLKTRITPEHLQIYQVGVWYHLIHGLAILLVALILVHTPHRANQVNMIFLSGIVLFSGSLYLLAVTGVKALGMITPIGGLLLIAGWLLLALR